MAYTYGYIAQLPIIPGGKPGKPISTTLPNAAPVGEANVDFSSAAIGVLPGVDSNVVANPASGFGCLVSRILTISMVIASLMLLLYLLMGGIEWISSGGDKGKIEKARGRITNAVIGIIVLSASVAILGIVQSFLGITTINFGGNNSCNSGSVSSVPGNPGGNPGGSNPGNSCTVGTTANDGGAGSYCTQGAAIVRCNGPDNHLTYNHYDPCYCVNGAAYQKSGIDFDSC